MNFLFFEKKEGVISGGCLTMGKKTHIHLGNKAVSHCMGACISLSKKNDILFVYGNSELLLIQDYIQSEYSHISNALLIVDGGLVIKIGFKKINIKSLTNFINGYVLLFENPNNDLMFIKKTQAQMLILLQELDYILKRYNDR